MKKTVSGYAKRIPALLVCLALLLGGCAPRQQETPKAQGKAYFSYFDTVSYVYSYAGDSAETFEARSADASAVLSEYHQLFDIYHEYAGVTNLCTINKQAGGEPVEVDQKLIDFLLYARNMYDKTQGEMNVMLGAVLRLWHDCRSQAETDPASAHLPDADALAKAAEHTSMDSLEIDPEKRTVRISDPKASIDVGALGKGYATEMAARALEKAGANSYVLNVGGNIRIIGAKPDGSGWVTGVRNPNDANGDFAASLYLTNTSCSTSGVYERYYVVDGKRYHHIINPDTLYPADYYSSITIVTPDSGYADALSTALFCLPFDEGMPLAQALGDAEVLWVFPNGDIRYTPGMADYIQK